MTKTTARYPAMLALLVILLAPLVAAGCGKSVEETIDDGTVSTQVKTALVGDAEVGGLRIDVDTFKGVVTLSGAVKTAAQRDKAVALANKVQGVKDVKSTLQIVP
jgi:osmotically-inducible protein OsmY